MLLILITFFAFFATVPSSFSSPTRLDDEKKRVRGNPYERVGMRIKAF